MNVRRVLILSITTLAAGTAGYALLGLRAPKQVPTSQAAPSQAANAGIIIAVGPDGTLYAIQAPGVGSGSSGTYYGGTSPYDGTRQEGGERGAFDRGFENE